MNGAARNLEGGSRARARAVDCAWALPVGAFCWLLSVVLRRPRLALPYPAPVYVDAALHQFRGVWTEALELWAMQSGIRAAGESDPELLQAIADAWARWRVARQVNA